jgi:hypothetical protein
MSDARKKPSVGLSLIICSFIPDEHRQKDFFPVCFHQTLLQEERFFDD